MSTKARWTPEQYEQYLNKINRDTRSGYKIDHEEKEAPPQKPKKPKMNKTEAEYECMLKVKARDGEIKAYLAHESIKFKIGANRCWYTPDFAVIANDGVLEMHEVKGPYVRDDARVKFQAATQLYPGFRWVWSQRNKNGHWDIKVFN